MRYFVNDNFFDEYTEKSMYWAGFLAADGNVEKSKPRIIVRLKLTDKEHLEKFKSDLNCNAPITEHARIDNRPTFKTGIYYSARFRFTSKQITKALKENFSITPTKSKILEFPMHLKNHPFINHFIRGVMDGDGSVFAHTNHGVISLCGTRHVVENVFYHLITVCNLSTSSGAIFQREDGLWIFNFYNLDHIKPILKYLQYDQNTPALTRKKENALQILTFVSDLEKQADKFKILNKDAIKNMLIGGASTQDLVNNFKYSSATIQRTKKIYGLIGTNKNPNPFKQKKITVNLPPKLEIILYQVRNLHYSKVKNLNTVEKGVWHNANKYIICGLYQLGYSSYKISKMTSIHKKSILITLNDHQMIK